MRTEHLTSKVPDAFFGVDRSVRRLSDFQQMFAQGDGHGFRAVGGFEF